MLPVTSKTRYSPPENETGVAVARTVPEAGSSASTASARLWLSSPAGRARPGADWPSERVESGGDGGGVEYQLAAMRSVPEGVFAKAPARRSSRVPRCTWRRRWRRRRRTGRVSRRLEVGPLAAVRALPASLRRRVGAATKWRRVTATAWCWCRRGVGVGVGSVAVSELESESESARGGCRRRRWCRRRGGRGSRGGGEEDWLRAVVPPPVWATRKSILPVTSKTRYSPPPNELALAVASRRFRRPGPARPPPRSGSGCPSPARTARPGAPGRRRASGGW